MCRCFFVPLLLQQKKPLSVALLCCSVSFSLQKTPFEILIVFILLYSLLLFICKAWMENDSFCQRALLKLGGLFSLVLWQALKSGKGGLRLSWDLLSSSGLGMVCSTSPFSHVESGDYLICFSHFQNLYLAGILGECLGIPAVSSTFILILCVCSLWSAQGTNPSCCAQDFIFVRMVLISLWHFFNQVTSIYPRPAGLMLLECHGEHEGLDCAFGSAPTVGIDSVDSPAGGNNIRESQNSTEPMEIHGTLPVWGSV